MEMSPLATSRMWQASYGAIPVQGSFPATQIQLLPWEERGGGVTAHEVGPWSIPEANGARLPQLSTTWRASWDRDFGRDFGGFSTSETFEEADLLQKPSVAGRTLIGVQSCLALASLSPCSHQEAEISTGKIHYG